MNTEDREYTAGTAVKSGYLAELRRRLAALPEEERESALTYYGEYFDDAGPEEADRVLNELGPAKTLAEQILSGYSRDYVDVGTQNYSTQVPATPEDAAKARQREEEEQAREAQPQHAADEQRQRQRHQQAAAQESRPQRRSGASLLLIILLAILALPLLIPLIATVLAAIVGLMAAALSVVVAIGASVLVMLVLGGLLLVAGMGLLVAHTASALLACGVGLSLLGLGMLLAMLCGFVCIKVVPALIRFTVQILRWPFERRAVRA